jgi:DNA polymerase III subunit alpha
MTINFAHLHVHTSIGSMQDAMTPVDGIFKRAKEFGQTALAITDHGTMAAIFDARKAAKKYDVKYIPGLEAYFVEDAKAEKQKRSHLVLLAKNQIGYKNLLKINYEGYVNSRYVAVINKVFPQIDWDILQKYHEGIICLTACGSGLLANEMFKKDENEEWNQETCHMNVLRVASKLKKIFEQDFYLEVQSHDFKKYKFNKKRGEFEKDINGEKLIAVDQSYINRKLLEVSKELDIKVVATCDVHYLNKEDAKIHDMLMAINDKKPLSDPDRHKYEIEEFYMKSNTEVHDYFSKLFDKKIASQICNTTIEVTNKCDDSVYIDTTDIRFPKFNVDAEDDYSEFLEWKKLQPFNGEVPKEHAYLRFKCVTSFKQMYKHLDEAKRKEYKQRIIDEIKVLEMHNFCSYILIVADFIKQARKQGIRVGPGRGSVGGCLVANLLGIHEVDPIQYGLLFERFHNKEKKSFPDIDTDFGSAGRDWVEKYVVNKYGKDKVAHVSNLATMTPKVVIKDVARSLELGGNKSEAFKIANNVTDTISIDSKTFDDAFAKSEDFRKFCAQYPDIEKYGKQLVGLEKTYSTHAAGIVISDIDLSTYVPLRYDKEGNVSVQYEKNRCEAVGLIKMDLLGLEHLDIIDETIKNVIELGEECVQPQQLAPFDDKAVWNMISEGQTVCVFQMGSPHMRALCKQIKPKNIEDLSLVNALGRPSAVKSRDSYIARRDGREKIRFLQECLEPALKETLGICVYEEQLAKLAKHAAGWDLNKADGLRKLTKLKEKGKDLAIKLKEEFIQDAMGFNKFTREQALDIWEKIIEPFEGYGFNKAHGIFYSINGYHTAYYKHHYPAAFMAAVLKSEVSKASSNEEKIRFYKKEAGRMGIKIVTPDINKSDEYFSVSDKKTIRMGLAAVKGVGTKAVESIMKARNEHLFVSFADFLYRTNSNVVKKNVIQSLAKAGCFDSLGISRKAAYDLYAIIRKKANKHAEKKASIGSDSWDMMSDLRCEIDGIDQEWTKKEILTGELETLNEYISGTINELYDGFFTGQGTTSLSKIKKMADKAQVRVEAIIESVTPAKIQSGKNKGSVYARCTLIDVNKDSTQMTIWANIWKKVKDKVVEGKPIRAMCRVNVYKGTNTLVLDSIEKIME